MKARTQGEDLVSRRHEERLAASADRMGPSLALRSRVASISRGWMGGKSQTLIASTAEAWSAM